MDDIGNRLANELFAAIAAAVVNDPRVEACHRKAHEHGFRMEVSLEATSASPDRSGRRKPTC